MANRTIRRAYKGTNGNTPIHADSNGSIQGGESEQSDGIKNIDRIADSNGNDDESNTDSASGVSVIEVGNIDEYIGSGAGSGTESGNGDSGEPRKRRGRKPGSKNATRKTKAETSVEPFLMMAHTWASVLLKTPEIALEEDEAKQLSDAYAAFCEHHDVPVISPKRMSEINMIAALFMVYGPRFVAVRNRIKEENKVKKAKNVTEFSPQPVN